MVDHLNWILLGLGVYAIFEVIGFALGWVLVFKCLKDHASKL